MIDIMSDGLNCVIGLVFSPCPLCLCGEYSCLNCLKSKRCGAAFWASLVRGSTMSSALPASGGRLRSLPRIDHFRRRAVGRTIRDVGRVGKRVVVHLDSRDAIVLEPRMTGLVLVADPPSREHLRFRCTLSGNAHRRASVLGPPRAGKCSPDFAGRVRNCVRPVETRPRCPPDDGRLVSRPTGQEPAAGEGRAAGSEGGRGNRQFVCVRDFARRRQSTRPSGATKLRAPNGRRSPTPRARCSKRPSATKAQRSATARTATR